MRSEADKWRVPESDPAGHTEKGSVSVPRSGAGGGSESGSGDEDRGNLIFCGMCGALNPSSNFFCAACGSTLVDAFHATEGLRVFERPDAASRIIEIVPSGSELDVVPDPDAPTDYTRIRLPYGRLGYIRMAELDALAADRPSRPSAAQADINTNARGCVSSTAALGSLVLLILLASGTLYLLNQDDSGDSGFLALVTCIVIAPLALLMIFLYLMARDREDRQLDREDEETSDASS